MELNLHVITVIQRSLKLGILVRLGNVRFNGFKDLRTRPK